MNFKNLIKFSLIFITIGQLSNNSYAISIASFFSKYQPLGTAAVEQACKGLDDLSKSHLPTIGEIATNTSSQLGENAANVLSESVVKTSPLLGENFGLKATEKLAAAGPALTVIAGAVVAVHGVTQLYPIGKEIAAYVHPSEEQKKLSRERLKAVQQRLDLLDAENAFRQCLIKNRLNADRAPSGLPRVCQDAAETLAFLGKDAEVERVTAYFNKIRQ